MTAEEAKQLPVGAIIEVTTDNVVYIPAVFNHVSTSRPLYIGEQFIVTLPADHEEREDEANLWLPLLPIHKGNVVNVRNSTSPYTNVWWLPEYDFKYFKVVDTNKHKEH